MGHRGYNTKQAQLQRGWGRGRHEEDCWEEEEAPPIGTAAADIASGRRRRRKRSGGRGRGGGGGGRGTGGCLWELFPGEE